ncbi:cobalt-precorrin-4 methyltransferase [Vibrio viridaestus]|uniref:Cobalt-precorrin-4 methyltransferase n=1 Tax=Vibrio viridaestus TaxID=2487322 RepID=A0A3N9TLR4_9VIBR|nr:cobalt-precorrin-4 methyltransferase [Vibrio viridaestus]RQW64555.1 cobalt-precorrin-4 methyltransferase [Vibrio viridaestus]
MQRVKHEGAIDKSLVYFVGAGPGDPELLTLKGHRYLSQADIVIYAGSLVNPELLHYCKEEAVCIDSAPLNLGQILEIMEQGIKGEKLVIRLQTGDLSLYGSIREQGEELEKRGIGFRSIAGVSSFLGAAAELGVEYTVPEVAQSLIITRMAGRTPTPELENLASFARHQTSMAIFLSVQGIEKVVEQLIQGGYDVSTPAAVVYKATWPDCQKLDGTLETIVEKVKSANINKTALILVGKFLGKEYHYSKLYDAEFSHEYR